jgi:putative salt-induced outer membrane protein YdiY
MAKNTYRSSMISIEKETDEFENEISRTVNSYNHSVNLWFIAERTHKLAKDQYSLTVREYVMGRATAYELITSQQEQSSAMQKYYDAIRNAYENHFKIRELTLYDFEKNAELTEIFLNN